MKLRIQVPAILIVLTITQTGAHAKPDFLQLFLDTYKPYASQLTERSCANCHMSVSDFKLNLYGKQIAEQLVAANTKKLTTSILQKVEPMDANGDGVSNIEAIKAAKAPGDPNVTKVASAAAKPAPSEPKEEPAKPIVPKNAYHPAIVHFPIALFLAGLVLDLVGYLRKKDALLFAGWCNLVVAAVTSLGGLLSGYTATLLMKLPISGLIQQHMILAICGTFIMWLMVGLRARRHERMSMSLRAVYYVLAVAGIVLISYSGHLGGLYVYGE